MVIKITSFFFFFFLRRGKPSIVTLESKGLVKFSKVFFKIITYLSGKSFEKIAWNMEDLDFIVLLEMPVNFQLLQFTPLKLGLLAYNDFW